MNLTPIEFIKCRKAGVEKVRNEIIWSFKNQDTFFITGCGKHMKEKDDVPLINRYIFFPLNTELQRELCFKLQRLLMEILRNNDFHLNIKHMPINVCFIV